jgi:hypothetical protein
MVQEDILNDGLTFNPVNRNIMRKQIHVTYINSSE